MKNPLRRVPARAHGPYKKFCRHASLTLLWAVLLLTPFHFTLGTARALTASASTAASVTSPFSYSFNVPDSTLQEAGSMGDSSSPYFWVNSGAYLLIQDGLGKTVQGALPASDPWRVLYNKTNPLDTGNGYYPQNIFRFVTRSKWTNDVQQVQFKIVRTNLTDTPNRGAHSGVLFFSRYRDGDNVYYAGIRMDGTATIKKKVGGVYYTMASAKVFPGIYDRMTNPTLLPQKQWMRLRLVTQDQPDGSVALTLYLDQGNTGAYVEIARGVDRAGAYGGTPVISGSGYAGIRTDFQDVFFNDFKLTTI